MKGWEGPTLSVRLTERSRLCGSRYGFPVAEYTSPYTTRSQFARNVAPDGNADTVIPRLFRAFFEVLATLV